VRAKGLEETETSHTLGGTIKYTSPHQSHWFSHRSGCVVWTDAPTFMCERGVWGREGVGSESLSDTLRYINLTGLVIGLVTCEWGVCGRGGYGFTSDVRYFLSWITVLSFFSSLQRIKRNLVGEEGRCRCYERQRVKVWGNSCLL
jgi:hypothetical protein